MSHLTGGCDDVQPLPHQFLLIQLLFALYLLTHYYQHLIKNSRIYQGKFMILYPLYFRNCKLIKNVNQICKQQKEHSR